MLTKISKKNQITQIKQKFRSYFENLDVEEKILGINAAGWLQVSIEGEDEKIATNYLIKKIGLCPTDINNLKENSQLSGKISSSNGNNNVFIDIGVFKPRTFLATISLKKLQEQLAQGKKNSFKKIVTLFGLTEGQTVNITLLNINKEKDCVEAEFSEKQLSLFNFWQKSFLDRLIILGSTYNEAKKAINLARLGKDVINIESASLFEQVLTCKLGTDAAGLIPRLGKILRTAKLTVFNPKKIHLFFKTQPQLIAK